MAAAMGSPPYPQCPVLPTDKALISLVINVFVPGIGTIVAGVLGNKPMIGRGVAQFLLGIVIVGWIWGIVTGVQLLQNAKWAEAAQPAPAPMMAAR